ncbi:general transcription factor IIH subunit 4-like [Watersipora subatra]|uniref:general transcription factor IIH subunit 4-like n=1 Tax=Watersipora subatra TaxID=2589382 RepID=UPI00355C7822
MPNLNEKKQQLTFLEFTKSLAPAVLEQLYTQPTTCIAVYRELPILARHIIARILFVNHPVPKSVVSSWVTSDYQSEQLAACEKLSQLRIWQEHQIPGGLIAYNLNDIFRANFQRSFHAQEDIHTTTSHLGPDKNARDIAFLDKYASERWEIVLHFLVGTREARHGGITPDIHAILLHSGLMKLDNDDMPIISELGFQFLLMDRSSQVWNFIQQYLATVESRSQSFVECITFLLQLNFATLGKDFPTESLTDSQQRFVQHLRELGLVYQRKRLSNRFYPTRLAVNIVTGQNRIAGETKDKGFIVVETNYRVYAYTDSPLHVALLSLFCDMLYRFPNMVVGNITRDSVRQALMHGIKSEQIINYLTMHAHREMVATKPILPATIIDQIRLWEIERDRFEFTEGVLYNQFISQSEYDKIRDFAKDIGVLICENAQTRTIVVDKQGHDDVKKFWKRQKKS